MEIYIHQDLELFFNFNNIGDKIIIDAFGCIQSRFLQRKIDNPYNQP